MGSPIVDQQLRARTSKFDTESLVLFIMPLAASCGRKGMQRRMRNVTDDSTPPNIDTTYWISSISNKVIADCNVGNPYTTSTWGLFLV
jgi:hypothetical protein